MNSPDISVAIPSSGRWPLLARALRSALAQTIREVEVIVALDTPRTEEASAEVLGACDRRARFVRPERRGLSHARNAAIDAARGEWIAFLDDDDLWAPTKLDRQLHAAGEHAEFVYGAALVVNSDLEPLETREAPSPAELPRALLGQNAIPAGASNVLVNADVLRRCGAFDPQFRHLADWDLWIRLASCAQAAAVPEVIVAHVRHADSMLFRAGGSRKEFKRLVRKHGRYAAELGEPFDDRVLLGWLQTRHEAAGHRARAQLFRFRRVLRHGRTQQLTLGGDQPPAARPEWLPHP
jgi:glycosyltransferase involved in cell wall biosynthesis